MLGDGGALYALILNQLAGHAARPEAAQLAAALYDNVALGDGDNLITAANTTTETGLDTSALDDAMALLRSNTTSAGAKQNIRSRYLLIPPGKEATAAVPVAGMTPPSTPPRLEVVVNPWLTGSDFYVLADPEESTVFARV
jgi:hypothetical protein